MEGITEDMWSPYKHLQKTIHGILSSNLDSSVADLEICLKKYKQSFISLLRNPPRNEEHRTQLRNGMAEGIIVPGNNKNFILSKDLVDETIIISDMFDLDEIISLQLLCTAQVQMPQHPGLPRGLVAILLYYDGRKALTHTLRDLFQVTSGISWSSGASKSIISTISIFTQSLVEHCNILTRIMELLDELDFSKETNMLTKNRALGSKKHQNQVRELFEDIRMGLATCLFNWSAQRGLPFDIVEKLIKKMNKYEPNNSAGGIDDITLTEFFALLYAYDVSVLQRKEDTCISVQRLPLFCEQQFIEKTLELLDYEKLNDNKCFLQSVIKFSFALTLASLRHVPVNFAKCGLQFLDRDEELLDDAISKKVFNILTNYFFKASIIFRNEFFYRRVHLLLTDFIDYMHSKVTELRGKADETARTIMNFSKEGLEPPTSLDRSFESFLLCVGKFYENNRAGLGLCTEYWGPLDPTVESSNSTARSVSLFKFIRLAGELLPSTLFVPYLKMISGLTSCERSARNAFNLLKQTSGLSGSSSLSWEHFFGSLSRYYTNLREEQYAGFDTIYRNRTHNRTIKPQEIDGLMAVLDVIKSVATYDEFSRLAICDQPHWNAIHVLFGLLSCSVPLMLKAKILETLSAMALSKEIAVVVWNRMESSQIISTIPNTHSNSNLAEEINQNECRSEFYPLTQGVLDLLYTLVNTSIPKNLGGGPRKPGFDPYLTFLINGIFLKFYNRNYKNSNEKWIIGQKCLKILQFLLSTYDVKTTDFGLYREENPHPGYHIMLQLHTKSEVLKLILLIIDESRYALDEYSKFNGKEMLEECAYYCLSMIEIALNKQAAFMEAHCAANSSILLNGLNKMLLDINPRSGRPDHIINITKFVTYSAWLPRHTLLSIKILKMICHQANITNQILGIYSQNELVQAEILQGFVENLESEIPLQTCETEDVLNELGTHATIQIKIKDAIIQLLQDSLQQYSPNLTSFLLGLDSAQNQTQKRTLHSLDLSTNCIKAIVNLLDNYAMVRGKEKVIKCGKQYNSNCEKLIERAYYLLFLLCAHPRISAILLRYLRLRSDFLCRHLVVLSEKNLNNFASSFQISHILKCFAIELKNTATNCQTTRYQNLCELLVGVSGKSTNDSIPMELNNYYPQCSGIFEESLSQTKESHKNVNLLSHILHNINLETHTLSMPKCEFFDNSLTSQIFKDCEIKSVYGNKVVNVKKLNEILFEELSIVQTTIASGQRKMILNEIETVLKFVLDVNNLKNNQYATVKLVEALGQVTEILFSCCPASAIPIGTKKVLLIEILQKMLSKVMTVLPSYEIAILISGTTLMLLVNLRYCYSQELTFSSDNVFEEMEIDRKGSKSREETFYASKSDNLSFKHILKNLLEWILASGIASQKLRINLYSSLLSVLSIMKLHSPEKCIEKTEEFFISRLDKTISNQNHQKEFDQIGVVGEVIKSYGDQLTDIICNDAISGHDICKMAALSCLDSILDMESLQGTIDFMSSKGYLSHIIQGLLKYDDSLCRVMVDSPDNMKPLYVYESTMAMLLRMAHSYVGAELLLSGKLLSVMANMQVYDMHPDLENASCRYKKHCEKFVPSLESRFRQILFPALNLCDAIISTLGPENHSAISQVLHFLLSHSEMIEIVLRNANPLMDLGFLEELSALTGLIARTANQEIFLNEQNLINYEESGNLHRIQRLMLSAFNKFIVNDVNFKNMNNAENVLYEFTDTNKTTHVRLFLEIASNIALFCRNSVTNHSADHKAAVVMFSPTFSDNLQRADVNNSLKTTQHFSIVLNQLKGSVDYFHFQKLVADNFLQQRCALSNISVDENGKRSFLEYSKLYKSKQNELSMSVFIAEQCLYLLWCHLDFFVRRYHGDRLNATNNVGKLLLQDNIQQISISHDDVSCLKKNIVSLFNETFCKQLLSTCESSGQGDIGFNQALLRRIKSLTQLI